MGSNQSNQGNKEEYFISIDPSGNISNKRSSSSPSVVDSTMPATATAATNQKMQPEEICDRKTKPDAPKQPQLQAQHLQHHNHNHQHSYEHEQESDLSLKEADEIVSRMRAKYKPELAGKHHNVFNDIEQNIVQCYKKNKGQTMNCSKVFNDYRQHVVMERDRLLKKSSGSAQVPIMTLVMVVITCLLLHIVAPVSCYGAMSIDLGSEWMKVGLVAPSVQMDIVLNAQSQRKTPMAVAFSNGERFIGDPAMDVASKYPERTYTHFLDLVGKQTIEHDSVQHYLKRFPYAKITNPQAAKKVENYTQSIILNHPEGLEFTPLELVAMMLQNAQDQVANVLTSSEPCTDVVITVPPFFGPQERLAIEEAAKLVGLNVLRLTSVNSAFALSYGIFRHKDYLPRSNDNTTTILFFDQGASHTSATLADYHLAEHVELGANGVSKNESLPTITVRAQAYDRYLGGFDMQLKLRDYLVETFAKLNKIDEAKIFKRGKSASKLLKEAGRVKKILSANTDHTVRVENVIDDKDLRHPITRQEFEELNQEYLGDRIVNLLDRLFEMPGISRSGRLESVIIVGGNTRTPKIQQTLLDYFKLDNLGKSINADEGAALAALYQAASLGRGFRVKRFVLEEYNSTELSQVGSSEGGSQPEELEVSRQKLIKLKEEDNMRLHRLSLKNALESLLSEAREKLSDEQELQKLKEVKDELEKLTDEARVWLEDGPLEETDNVTILAEKFQAIHQLIHPLPPPPPPASTFDPSELSKMFSNDTLNMIKNGTFEFLKKFRDSTGENKDSNNDTETSSATSDGDNIISTDGATTTTPSAAPATPSGGATTTSTPAPSPSPLPTPVSSGSESTTTTTTPPRGPTPRGEL